MNKISWTAEMVRDLYELPFFELINQAYQCHIEHFDPSEIEFCALCSIKTGACPEDCAYCPQSGHYNTGLKRKSC